MNLSQLNGVKRRVADAGEACSRAARTSTLLLIVIGAAVARVGALARDGGPRTASMVYDDGVYVAAGGLLRQGWVPYRDFVLVHPPASSYVVAIVSFIVRDPDRLLVAMRFVMVAVGLVNVVLVVKIVQRCVGPIEAAVAGVVYVVLPEAVYAEHTVILEPWLNVACLAGVLAWLSVDDAETHGERRTGPRGRALTAGGLLAVAFSFKLWAGFCVVACLLTPPRANRQARILDLAAGGAIGVAALWGPMFLLSPRAMLDQVVLFQWRRPADGVDGALARLSRMVRPDEITHAGAARMVFVLAVVVVATAMTVLAPGRLGRLACIWFVIVVTAFLTSPTWWEQYSAHLAAVFALLTGVACHALVAGARSLRARARAVPATLLSLAGIGLLTAFVVESSHYESSHSNQVENAARDVARFVPPDACVVSLEPGWLVAAGRLPQLDDHRRFAVDPYAALLLGNRDRDASLREVFDDPSQQRDLAYAIDSCAYLVVSDFRMSLMLSPDLRGAIAAEFISLSDTSAGIRVLAHR